jgi:hypothetical protein
MVVRDSRNQKKSITHTTGDYLDAELNHSDEAKFSATITKVMASSDYILLFPPFLRLCPISYG